MDNENDMKIHMLKEKLYERILDIAPLTSGYT